MSLFNSDYQPISTAAPATAATDEAPAPASATAPSPVPVKGKAVTYSGTYNVGLADITVPEVVNDDDVVIKITATTLCGSDLHLWHGEAAGIPTGEYNLLNAMSQTVTDRRSLQVPLWVMNVSVSWTKWEAESRILSKATYVILPSPVSLCSRLMPGRSNTESRRGFQHRVW